MDLDKIDKSELILESYQISGIHESECRSVFLDWLLKLPADINQSAAVQVMIDTYAVDKPEHPMSRVLFAAQNDTPIRKRRGGRAGRISG